MSLLPVESSPEPAPHNDEKAAPPPAFRFLIRLAKRLGWAVLTLTGTVLLTFIIMFSIPADPARVIAGAKADPQTIAAIRHQLGLDLPWWRQLGKYFWDL